MPGYLIVEPLAPCQGLADLDADQAADLLKCLAAAEAATVDLIEPARVYVLKFGEENPRLHFHVVPRTERIRAGYLSEVRDEKPYSGARIADWIWQRHETLGFTDDEVERFVRSARARLNPAPRRRATESASPDDS